MDLLYFQVDCLLQNVFMIARYREMCDSDCLLLMCTLIPILLYYIYFLKLFEEFATWICGKHMPHTYTPFPPEALILLTRRQLLLGIVFLVTAPAGLGLDISVGMNFSFWTQCVESLRKKTWFKAIYLRGYYSGFLLRDIFLEFSVNWWPTSCPRNFVAPRIRA